MRTITPFLLKDLTRKAVLLSGPRQVGKSTLAKSLLNNSGIYLNLDIPEDRRRIIKQSWPRDASILVLDELHKLNKWKNYLKGVIDRDANRPNLLVTGSARLETFRRAGDALTGRTFHYRLHPLDALEASNFMPSNSVDENINRLLTTGGFPESFLNPQDAPRLLADRLSFVVKEDLRDLSAVTTLRAIEVLVDLLRERVSGQISYQHLGEDLSVSAPTIKSWITLLERLYIVFILRPYSTRALTRSLIKEPKLFFFDCAASLGKEGTKLENLVACSLLKYCDNQFDIQGRKLNLWYYRDRDGREVDFIVTEGKKVMWCIEVKSSDAEISPALKYIHQRLSPVASVQLVRSLTPSNRREEGGIKVEPLGDWLVRNTEV